MKGKYILTIAGITVAVPFLASAQCQSSGRYWNGMGYGGTLYPYTMLTGLLLWILIIGVGIYLFKQLLRSSEFQGTSRSLDIARERYAKGEIDKDEFEEIQRELKKS